MSGSAPNGAVYDPSTEVYDPRSNAWQAVADVPVATSTPLVEMLANGAVLVGGGSAGPEAVSASMLYESAGTEAIDPPDEPLAPAAVPPATAPGSAPTSVPDRFVDTGADVALPVTIALLLVVAGIVFVTLGRRRVAR